VKKKAEGKKSWGEETLEDVEKLREEAKELCEKRSGSLLLRRAFLGVKGYRMEGELLLG